MTSKLRKARRRSQSKYDERHFGIRTYGLIMSVIVLAVAVVATIVILDQDAGRSQPVEISLDKSDGAEDAPVVVVEYADFQCPFCRQFATGPERRLREDYVESGQVRFAFRYLAFIGNESRWAAEASECANEQGRFWNYHDKLFEEQGGENVGTFSQDNLKRFAAELELDAEQFNQCLDSGEYRNKVQQEVAEGEQLGVRSTPTIFVNGQLITPGSDYQTLQAAVKTALSLQ